MITESCHEYLLSVEYFPRLFGERKAFDQSLAGFLTVLNEKNERWYGILIIMAKTNIMEIVTSLLIVIASFIVFATISYFLVKSTFTRIENDEWEEKYLQMKKQVKASSRRATKSYMPKAKVI
jgi:hypothetical protein